MNNGDISLLNASFRFSAGLTFMSRKPQVGSSRLSRARLRSCMQAKGHCWIRVQQQDFHVASCCAQRSQKHAAAAGALRWVQKASSSLCNQSQLASPHFEDSLQLFSPSHQSQGSSLSIYSFVLIKFPMDLQRLLSFLKDSHFLCNSAKSGDQGLPKFTSKPHC